MAKKINPIIFRMKQVKTWDSRWFALSKYAIFLKQDLQIKAYLRKSLAKCFVSDINIERNSKEIKIIIFSARPGMIIGRSGADIELIKKEIKAKFLKNQIYSLNIVIKEIANPNLDAKIVGQSIKVDIEKRVAFRRAMKQAIGKVERAGAKGVKIQLSGRLNGVEIARTEKLLKGKVPLHTLRADIDYALTEANTMYGVIGIKVWIYKGDIFSKNK